MRLAASNLPAAQDVSLYTVPSLKRAVLSVSLCNRTNGPIKVRMGLAASAAPEDSDWIEYDVAVPANGVLERTGLALGAGQSVFVRADVAGLSAVAFGIEEAN